MAGKRALIVTRNEFVEYCKIQFRSNPEKFGAPGGKKCFSEAQRKARLDFWNQSLQDLYGQGVIGRRHLGWECPFVPKFKKTKYRPGGRK